MSTVSSSRQCPSCDGDVGPTVVIPDAPTFWVRRDERGWHTSTSSPTGTEKPTLLAYSCRTCEITLRIVATTADDAIRLC